MAYLICDGPLRLMKFKTMSSEQCSQIMW